MLGQRATLLIAALAGSICVFLTGCSGTVVNAAETMSLVASPASVNLGSIPVGSATSATVSVANKSSAAVSVTQMSVTGQSFSVNGQTSVPVSIPAGGTLSVNVNFVPSSAGQETGQLSISSDASTTPTLIDLVGTGSAAAAAANTTPQLSGLSCSSASMGGTATDLCTATISVPAPEAGFRVALSSNNPAVTVSPAGLIHANMTSVQFMADSTPVTAAQTATLTASAGGVTETFALQLNVPVATLSLSPS
ncbi:MAG TPA: choice-of-anchor D domain-containing protein, partial [Terracidiphilus sp.]